MIINPSNSREAQGRHVVESIGIGVVLTGLSYLVGLRLGWITKLNWLEVFAVFTSYSCTYLCVKERRINYPIGAISSAAYAYLFLKSGLLSSAVLNLYLVPTLVYGWIRWRPDSVTRPVTRTGLRWLPVYLAGTALCYWGAAALSQHLGGAMAWPRVGTSVPARQRPGCAADRYPAVPTGST